MRRGKPPLRRSILAGTMGARGQRENRPGDHSPGRFCLRGCRSALAVVGAVPIDTCLGAVVGAAVGAVPIDTCLGVPSRAVVGTVPVDTCLGVAAVIRAVPI